MVSISPLINPSTISRPSCACHLLQTSISFPGVSSFASTTPPIPPHLLVSSIFSLINLSIKSIHIPFLHPSCPSVINVLSAIPLSLSCYQSLIHHASFILSLLFICTFLPRSADSSTPSLFPSINSEHSLPSLPPFHRSWLWRPSPRVCIQSDYTRG